MLWAALRREFSTRSYDRATGKHSDLDRGGPMLEGITISGALVWIVANFAYVPMVRDRERGYRRFAAFVLGWPGTHVSYFVIRPTRRAAEPLSHVTGVLTRRAKTDVRCRAQLEMEEERDLLMEIRRDRALRISRRQAGDEGAVDEEA